MVERFLEELRRERGLGAAKIGEVGREISCYSALIESRDLTAGEVAAHLETHNVFIVELFLRFLDTSGLALDDTSLRNNRRFRNAIGSRRITARDYDERIALQTDEFQIDNCYAPKSADQKRRVAVIMAALDPVPGEHVLDVGCGVGTFAYQSARRGARAVAVDYSLESIRMARTLAARFAVRGSARYGCCDAVRGLPFTDAAFDKVVAADFIEHISDREKELCLDEMRRVVKPGGRMVIFTPNRIREELGAIKRRLRRVLGAVPAETRLHYGLIDRFAFERMLDAAGLAYMRQFHDVNRPYLARIPLLKELLGLDLLWVITT